MNKLVQPLINELQNYSNKYVAADIVEPLDYQSYQNYLKTGNRIVFENQYFRRRRQLSVLSLSYYLKHDDQVIKLLENVIWEICNEYTWALPPHLPTTGNTYGVDSPQWIDLFNAETGETLAEIQELIGDRFSPEISFRINQELERRILKPFEDHDWDWQLKENNWSAVIGGCLGIVALIKLPKNSNRQKKILGRLDIAFKSYLNSFENDGACVEGVSYWAYGFGYYLYFADKIKQVLNDTYYLDSSKVKRIAAFPYYTELSKHSFVPFSDVSNIQLPTGLLSYCHDEFNVNIPSFDQVNNLDFDRCYRFAQLYRNLIWTSDQKSENRYNDRTHYYANVQWLIRRSDKHNIVFAAKGGHNNESHNHIDLGHFIFGTTNQLFLIDLGAGEYTKDYFNNDQRYNYLSTSARGHSIPTINGYEESPGPFRAQSSYDEAAFSFSLELAQTYPRETHLSRFSRQFTSSLPERTTIIKDDFKFKSAHNNIVERLITSITPIVDDHKITLTNQNESCELICNSNKITVEILTYPDHNGSMQTVYQININYSGGQLITTEIHLQLK